jgi:hypothetical protein
MHRRRDPATLDSGVDTITLPKLLGRIGRLPRAMT